MKKIAALLIAGTLIAATLSGCSNGSDTAADQPPLNTVPESTVTTEFVDAFMPDVMDVPVDATAEPAADVPDESIVPESTDTPAEAATETPAAQATAAPYAYTLTALTDSTFGFVCTYPSGWKNLPGKYTACFREEVSGDDFPARMAVTRKRLAHAPKFSRLLTQFQEYAETVRAQYDSKTFEYGDLNSSAAFLGQPAYEITYLAYSGDVEVKGYMICTNVDKYVYVFHFCAPYDDYAAMEPMMRQLRDSVTLAQ